MVTAATFDDLAELMIWSYLETAATSRRFRHDHGEPFNTANKTHQFRQLVQIKLDATERFVLDRRYADHGRVAFSDQIAANDYLVRSATAVEFNQARESELFDTSEYVSSPVIMILFKFDATSLHLSQVATKHLRSRFRLVPSGKPRSIGTWDYLLASGPSFSQGREDPFSELGDIDDVAEGAEL